MYANKQFIFSLLCMQKEKALNTYAFKAFLVVVEYGSKTANRHIV